ncbi:MAG: hypothetical protein ACR2JP_07675 [Acidimicrobiia bacterium]
MADAKVTVTVATAAGKESTMLIDCDTCVMQHTEACKDCIVSVLLAGDLGGRAGALPAGGTVELADDEAEALRNLAEVGLVAPLRLVVRDGVPVGEEATGEEATG